MSAGCHDHSIDATQYRNVLWIVFALNAGMFAIEIVAGALAGSVSLQADALDFFSDAATYLVTLYVLHKSLRWRAGAALVKASAMGLFGIYVLGYSAFRLMTGEVPVAEVMGIVGFLALAANVTCAMLLFRHRDGDSNRQSVWLCSRNDAIANVAVIVAAGLVYLTASYWPDLVAGFFMAALSMHSAGKIFRQAIGEWRGVVAEPAE